MPPGATCPIRERNPWDPVVRVNPAQPPSVSRCAPRSRSPVSLIVLTRSCSCRWGPCLSFSHPSFGVPVLFIYYSLVRSRRAPPVPLIVLPKSCSCRWGPCPRPIPRLACLFSFFLSFQQRLPGAEGPPEGRSTAPRHAACGGPKRKKERKKTDNPREGWAVLFPAGGHLEHLECDY